jgi:hypothetical protein
MAEEIANFDVDRWVYFYDEPKLSKLADEDPEFLRFTGLETPGWYFWHECESRCSGPFETRDIAITQMRKYGETL